MISGWSVLNGNLDLPESAHTAGLQNQGCFRQWSARPAHGKGTEDMPVRNDENISLRARLLEGLAMVLLSDIGNHGIESTHHVFWRPGKGGKEMHVSS